jgi:vacuolar iron transporter family protein
MSNTQSAIDTKHTALQSYFKEVIYGGIDGIVTTFAVVAGFSGAALSSDSTVQLSFMIVLLFGLANLFADAASMGLGNFLSVRSEQDLYNATRKRKLSEMGKQPESEIDETIALMVERGFSKEQAIELANIYRTNEDYWVDFLMTNKLEMSDPRGENPALTGSATFFSFLFFGSIPLLPFMFISSGDASLAFNLSIIGTFMALVVLGLLKWHVIGAKLFASLSEVITVGGTAAILAFIVGSFFKI